MSRLARNISANVLSNAWSTALSLLLTPLYVHYLGVESYGLIGFYMSWLAILSLLDTGISATAVREIAWLSARPGEAGTIPTLLRTLEVVYWGVLLALGVVMLAGAWWLGAVWFEATVVPPAVIRTALMLMVLSLMVQMPSGLYVGGLMGLQRQVEASALVAGFGTLRAAGALAVLAAVPDVRAFFAWQILASALQTGAMRGRLLSCIRDTGAARFSRTTLRGIGGFAGGMSLVTALSLVLAQMDKMILSRFVSLEAFGFYMLAWTVASGLSRVAGPFLQAFNPRFTELVSRGDEQALSRIVRLASQLTSAIVLPPAAMIAVLPQVILLVWIGDATIAAAAAPLLTVLTVGTLLPACAYPALTVLYSRNHLRPVIALNAVAVIVLLPLVTWMAARYGSIGTAFCWAVYGLVSYVAYLMLGLKGLPGMRVTASMLRDFAAPALVSFGVAAATWRLTTHVEGRVAMAAVVAAGLLAGWTATLLVCRDVFRIAMQRLRWPANGTLWSA